MRPSPYIVWGLKPLWISIGWGVMLGSAEPLGLTEPVRWLLRGLFLLSLGAVLLFRPLPRSSGANRS